MKRLLVLTALAALLFVVVAPSAMAADVTGTWKIEAAAGRAGGGGGGGRGPMEQTLVLKQDGSNLTGKLITKFGENTRETDIQNGKVNGDQIEFQTKTQGRDGQEMVTSYKAKVTENKMEGTRAMGERERPFTATKQ